jgi:hypothetical protein
MATIHKEILINAEADAVWDAARDFGALHTRLVPGFVVDTRLKPDADPPVRVVTFGNGSVLDEALVSSDDVQRRLVWTVENEQVRHHNGAFQVFPIEAGWCRAVWRRRPAERHGRRLRPRDGRRAAGDEGAFRARHGRLTRFHGFAATVHYG